MVLISATIFSAEGTTEKQLLFLAMIGCSLMFALACCVAGLWFRSRDKFRAFYPAMICLVGLPAGLWACFEKTESKIESFG